MSASYARAMTLVGPLRQLNPQAVQALTELAARTGRVPGVGHTPLGTPRWQEVNAVPSGRFSGHDASIAAWSENRDGRIDVFAQAWRGASDPTWVAEILVDPTMSSMTADVGAPLLSRLLQGIGTASTDQGAQRLELWVTNASAGHAELAARAGLAAYRTLHQMLRPLPIERTRKLTVRAFNVAADVEEVLEVNRRSFVAHPSQGDLTLEQFQQQMSEPWFDPNGFLIAEADTRIAGFCWTKLFDPDPTNARQGEIHVI